MDSASKFVDRNPGMPLDMGWVNSVQVNYASLQKRAETHKTRRSIKKDWQAAWFLRGVQCIDLTTLSGDDTETNVNRLCFKAALPVRQDLLDALGVSDMGITVGAVCVYSARVPEAVASLEGTGIPVAAVATGFPSGQTPLEQRLAEIRAAVAYGAQEIDVVVSRPLVLAGNWAELYREVRLMREACGEAHIKVILATGECGTMQKVYQASLVSMMAGADFIKTSTGKESVNATFETGFVMVRAIRDFYERTGFKVGFKPAGGIRSAKDVLVWLSLMKEELGDEWTQPHLFRMGASLLLTDIERQLYHHVYGRYAALHQLPIA